MRREAKGTQLRFDAIDGVGVPENAPEEEALAQGAVVLRGFSLHDEVALLADVAEVAGAAPFRHMETPGGFRMSAGMTSCGALGWVSDRRGYRYSAVDPASGRPWPAMPASFLRLAERAAERAGFAGMSPDSCLVNRYAPGARLTLHQDKNEPDLDAPIVSASLGLPAVFLFGGVTRQEKPMKVPLRHGDVVVWGGPSRLRYHGVMPIAAGEHARLGAYRINLTFRRAG